MKGDSKGQFKRFSKFLIKTFDEVGTDVPARHFKEFISQFERMHNVAMGELGETGLVFLGYIFIYIFLPQLFFIFTPKIMHFYAIFSTKIFPFFTLIFFHQKIYFSYTKKFFYT